MTKPKRNTSPRRKYTELVSHKPARRRCSTHQTWIPFGLSQDTKVTVGIYDVQGQRIRQLQLGQVAAGRYVTADQAAYWDGKNETGEVVSSGTYFYQIEAGDYTETRKMVILK